MNDYIYISEQDIFNFVHFPEQLNAGKTEYIHSHESLFGESIRLCRAVRDELSQDHPISDEIRRKLTMRIPSYQQLPVILRPLPGPQPLHQARYTLAAASGQQEPIPANTRTFINDQKNCLIRLIPEGKAIRCFVFTPEGFSIRDFRLAVLPSDRVFHLTSPVQLLDLSPAEPVEQLSLTYTRD